MMKTAQILLIAILASTSFNSFGQDEWTKERKERLADGELYFEITDYNRALKIFDRLISKIPNDPNLNYKIGVCHFYLDESKNLAQDYLTKAYELGELNSLFFLGQCYHLKEQFEKATNAFEKYKALEENKEYENEVVDHHLRYIENAKQLMSTPVDVNIYNIGNKVNSKYRDYEPLISADESIMIFTSGRPGTTGNKTDAYNNYYEDIYFAKNVNGKFEETQNIGEPVNTTTNDAAVGLTADGKTLIIYKTNRAQTAGDLYFSFYNDSVWSKPEKFSETINSEFSETSACLSPDGNTMYFSSTREGGFGGRDIYRTVLLPSGEWSLPLNMGANINTPYDEEGPFIHPDGKSLFFSSNGPRSMGGYDVFKSVYNGEFWSAPENLGYPINSVGNDLYFVLAANGKRGYYSSYNESDSASLDIYVISFESELQQMKIIKGSVLSANGNKPLAAKIKLYDEDDEIEGEFNTNAETGAFVVLASPDRNYRMTIEAEGFQPQTENLLFDGGRLIKEISKEIVLYPSE